MQFYFYQFVLLVCVIKASAQKYQSIKVSAYDDD